MKKKTMIITDFEIGKKVYDTKNRILFKSI